MLLSVLHMVNNALHSNGRQQEMVYISDVTMIAALTLTCLHCLYAERVHELQREMMRLNGQSRDETDQLQAEIARQRQRGDHLQGQVDSLNEQVHSLRVRS